jgi:predicted RND superfamily exporter protein
MINKLKEFLKAHKITVIIIAILALVVFLQNMHFGKTGFGWIDDFIGHGEESIVEQKDQEIQELNEKIDAINIMLSNSESKQRELRKKIVDLENQINNVKPPVGAKEIRDRFGRLGYSVK